MLREGDEWEGRAKVHYRVGTGFYSGSICPRFCVSVYR